MLHVLQSNEKARSRRGDGNLRETALLLLLVTVLPEALFALVGCNLMSFTFFTAGHLGNYLWVFTQGLLGQCRKIGILRLGGDLRH